MTIFDQSFEELKRWAALRRALFRWVAAIREALLKQLQYEIAKRDLNQCERILASTPMTIENDEPVLDPVLEIWQRDGERAGVYWSDFDPELTRK